MFHFTRRMQFRQHYLSFCLKFQNFLAQFPEETIQKDFFPKNFLQKVPLNIECKIDNTEKNFPTLVRKFAERPELFRSESIKFQEKKHFLEMFLSQNIPRDA